MKDPVERSIEALRPDLTPEEACLSALLDLDAYQDVGSSQEVGDFFTAFSGTEAPSDLRTRISTHAVEQGPRDPSRFSPEKSYVDGFEIAATVVIDFNTREGSIGEFLNLDFVKTSDGFQLMQRRMTSMCGNFAMRYMRIITEDELAALVRDATVAKERIVEESAELMKLGPLVEEESEDGTRRFHIGDILAVTTSKFVSPRGMAGIYDILGYMTDDSPFTTQLGRFAEECLPYLEQQIGEAIKPYSEVPETITDGLSLYKWLSKVTASMGGDPFLKVSKIGEKDHAVIDVNTELELDYGPEILDKLIQFDPKLFEADEE